MKIRVFISALALLLSIGLGAQSMEKGVLHFEGGIGLGIYRTTAVLNGYTYHDTAGAFVVPVTGEYGINRFFSIGGTFKYSNFLTDTANSETYHSYDLAVRPEFHFLNRNKFDMDLFALAGFSALKYNANNSTYNITGHGSGPAFGLGLDMRIFFSHSIGMYLSYNYATYSYPNFEYTDNTTTVAFDWSGKGSNFGLGLAVRIE
jgi:hypothetical protein